MTSSPFDQILNFINLLYKFRGIERGLLVKGGDRNENDSEHSFSLAMLAWYVNSIYKLNFNVNKLLKYALVHDLIEVYAGDVFFYHRNKSITDDKKKREGEAVEKLKKEFLEFPELHEVIRQYEKKEDKESKFIYALDKIEPSLNIYLDKGRSWKRDNVTLEMMKNSKKTKIDVDKTVEKIFDELVSRLSLEHDELFNKD